MSRELRETHGSSLVGKADGPRDKTKGHSKNSSSLRVQAAPNYGGNKGVPASLAADKERWTPKNTIVTLLVKEK